MVTTLDCTVFDKNGVRVVVPGDWILSFG